MDDRAELVALAATGCSSRYLSTATLRRASSSTAVPNRRLESEPCEALLDIVAEHPGATADELVDFASADTVRAVSDATEEQVREILDTADECEDVGILRTPRIDARRRDRRPRIETAANPK